MSTFAKSTFSAANYAAFRPSYPSTLYTTLLAHHLGPRAHAVDLGTGQGLVARSLSPHFSRITALDPSASMLATARALTTHPNITFLPSSAEDAPLPPASVDLLAAAQAAHWFDFSRFWPAAAAAVRTGGTLAFWGYMLHWFPGYPAAGQVVRRWLASRGVEVRSELAAYWPQPGRGIVEGGLREVVPPEEEWEVLVRRVREPWAGNEVWEGTEREGVDPAFVQEAEVSVADVKRYMRTSSASREWADDHPGPEHRMREEGGPGDVVDRIFDEIVEVEPEWADEEKMVHITWGTFLLIARRR